jgi:hypothetical protein
MCILPAVLDPDRPTQTAPACPAQRLPARQRQELAVAALAGTQPITHLAADCQVSRKFVYQQAAKAEQALAAAFAPEPPAAGRVLFWLPVTSVWLERFVLTALLVCHSSYRGVFEALRDLFHYPLSLGTLHNIARAAMDRARAHNQQQDLSAVGVGAHDELFQARQPVLTGVDVRSTYCYLLSLEEQRDAETWGIRLLELGDRGFAPQALISDGGTGLVAGQALALPGVPRRGDVFHVVHEVTPLATFLENRAYQALTACDKLERQQAQHRWKKGRPDSSLSQKLRHARPGAAAAVALADDVATLLDWLRGDILAVAGPSHADRCALYDFVIAELRARAPQCPHRLLRLCTYLTNQRDAVLAFAQQLDADLGAVAADFQVSEAVVRAVLDVHQRAAQGRRLGPHEGALRQHLGGRWDDLRAAVAAVSRSTVRASSVVENVNGRLRNYFFLRRHLGPDYLHLLQFYLNHRRFLRSEHPEREGRSPAELLTGQGHAHWLELLGLPDPLPN